MAGRFTGDAEIGAGAAPFGSVRCDPAAAGAVVGDEMGEFVQQGAPDLVAAEAGDRGIQLDAALARPRPAGAGAESRIPLDPQGRREPRQPEAADRLHSLTGSLLIQHGAG